ncbi:hypothetical protein WN48_01767 [Eufriesea mexicana]|uniref:Uncharacterized protein n=1 Tax=Eufriesea mexicana TaxID=516756 RepID=A0A310SBW0_9HYME|nr:hypothetical protein WN48_01767 [Eufriesea mexicana]
MRIPENFGSDSIEYFDWNLVGISKVSDCIRMPRYTLTSVTKNSICPELRW